MSKQIDNAMQLRFKLAANYPEVLEILSLVLSGPRCGGDLEPVLNTIFSEYFRYLYYVRGDESNHENSSFSWRSERYELSRDVSTLAKRDADMIICIASAYNMAGCDAYKIPAIRLLDNLKFFFSAVIDVSNLLVELELEESIIQEIARMRKIAKWFLDDVNSFACNSFASHLEISRKYKVLSVD